MPYKSAILGCGPRAEAHILAYDGLEEARLIALCDRDRKRLHDYGVRFRISRLYENLEEMLSRERPDILHIVTPPAIREEPMELAGRFGVKAVAVEKPIALNRPQARRIDEIARRFRLKVAVNTQRRYFRTCRTLKQLLLDGKLGDLRFLRAVTKGNILSWGPHMVDLILFFLNDLAPVQVWATAYGMNGYDYGHPAPANMLIEFTFPNGVVAYCEDSEDAVGSIGETDFWQHGEFNIWGTKGRAWWIQNIEWGYETSGAAPHIEKQSWAESDPPGQAAFTRALARWLADDSASHENCLANALRGFDVIMTALESALIGKRLPFGAPIRDDVVERLEEKLTCLGK